MTGPGPRDTADGGQEEPSPRRWLGWAVGALLALALAAFVAKGADRPPDPYLESPSGLRFGTVAFRVEQGGASTKAPTPTAREHCALLAVTDEQRAQGLMGRRDLGGYDAMVFRFDQDVELAFWMHNVPVPLSIAWFDADGRFVSSADMAVCGDEDDCRRQRAAPPEPYRIAVEVLQGGLGPLGIGPGSVLVLDGRCNRG